MQNTTCVPPVEDDGQFARWTRYAGDWKAVSKKFCIKNLRMEKFPYLWGPRDDGCNLYASRMEEFVTLIRPSIFERSDS